jgi:hypothetical protein
MRVLLGAAGATVHVTGRSTRSERSEMNRPETIENTAGLVTEAGGHGIVNNIWGATTMEWNKAVWETTLAIGLRTLRLAVDCSGRQPTKRLSGVDG